MRSTACSAVRYPRARASAAPRAISAVCAESVYVVLLIGSSAQLWRRTRGRRLVLGINKPSRNVAAEGDRPKGDRLARRTRKGGIQIAPLNARSNRRPGGGRCVADVRDASVSEGPCRASSRDKKSRATGDDGIHRPLGGAPVAAGNVPAAVRSRVALRAVANLPVRPSTLPLRPFQPFRCWVLRAVVPRAAAGSAPRDLKPTWRSGDRSPRETNSNYA